GLDAYQEFSDRTSALAETTGHLDAVTQAIERAPQRFTTKDLLAYLPATPVTLAKIVLNRMRLEGRLKTTLSETAVEWRKVNPASSSPPPNRAPP
ncbi:MAG: hypothetical protein PVF33_00090, partial [Candidatus Latescibacterota bacterium]